MCPHRLYKTNKLLHAFSYVQVFKKLEKSSLLYICYKFRSWVFIYIHKNLDQKDESQFQLGRAEIQENETKGKDHAYMARIGLRVGTVAQA